MASIILSTAGSAIGSNLGGPLGSLIGSQLGSFVGGAIDDKIFGPRRLPDYNGPRLSDLSVQSSAYGKSIPIIYGNARLSGNILWSLPIKEVVSASTVTAGGGKGGGGGGSASQTQITYSYFVTLAIGICEGVIDDVIRVWTDSEVINPNLGTYRLYKGTETQNPDPMIESHEGIGLAPAYRGLAYVVIEDFPLASYGNRIPNFTFEDNRRINPEAGVESKIKNIMMLPASGEFAYDTVVQRKLHGEYVNTNFVQRGKQDEINQNSHYGKADALVSMDQLKTELPNVEWVSVAVSWFANSLDAATCVLKPGVEYQGTTITSPDLWSVAGRNRATAYLITQVNGSAIYGGTPSDSSIVRYVTELRARGYKIMFYPFILMDVPGKPWRGHITGTSSAVSSFFTKTNGYNAFVSHYASLLNGKVDGFCIGSEMVGLTKVENGSHVYPAVTALASLATSVKAIMGGSTKITYAADWSEYHHTDGGWYNLDTLWASSGIDVIGIDAYFPLTDEPQTGYDKQKIMDGWTSGEGYDWYYSDEARTIKASLSPAYAWKNIEWWWRNNHVNPNGSTTSWVPESKEIWFTEFGFPSVDGCTNQPNVFYDPGSSESGFPRFSRGRVDYRAQSKAIEATLEKWEGSDFVKKLFLWTWDARPYPSFPEFKDVWGDGEQWIYGHWVTGKFGLTSLSEIIKDLCAKVGLSSDNIDLGTTYELVDGFLIDKVMSVRAAIEALQKAYFFDVTESGTKLKYSVRGTQEGQLIDIEELIPIKDKLITIKREHELLLPQKVDVNYISRAKSFQVGVQSAMREVTDSQGLEVFNLPIVMNDWQARQIADVLMYNLWQARTSYELALPLKYAGLEPGDLIKIEDHTIRITETLLGANGEIRVKGNAENNEVYDTYYAPTLAGTSNNVIEIAESKLEILDIPGYDTEPKLRFATVGLGTNWHGTGVFRSDDGGVSYSQFKDLLVEANTGSTLTALSSGCVDICDGVSTLDVLMLNGELESVSSEALLNGANIVLVGDEVIQFKNAELLEDSKYRLSSLYRGRLGTEWAISSHIAGERFVPLTSSVVSEAVSSNLIGVSRKYKGVSLGTDISSTTDVDFTFNAVSLKPYSPVSIKGTRDGSNNLTISWIRRTRIGGDLRDGVDVPISEESEKYEIDILNGLTVVRTINSTTPTASYSAANQVTDFGSVQSSVSVKIYQISAIVGRGTAGLATI